MLVRLLNFLFAAALFAAVAGISTPAEAHAGHPHAATVKTAASEPVTIHAAASVVEVPDTGLELRTASEPLPRTGPCADGTCSCCGVCGAACHASAITSSPATDLCIVAGMHGLPAPPVFLRVRAPSSAEQPPKSIA